MVLPSLVVTRDKKLFGIWRPPNYIKRQITIQASIVFSHSYSISGKNFPVVQRLSSLLLLHLLSNCCTCTLQFLSYSKVKTLHNYITLFCEVLSCSGQEHTFQNTFLRPDHIITSQLLIDLNVRQNLIFPYPMGQSKAFSRKEFAFVQGHSH